VAQALAVRGAVRRLLASRRRRRRLTWAAGIAIVAAGVVVIGIEFSNTGQRGLTKATPGGPPTTSPPPKTVPFRRSARQVQPVVAKFVRTAVLRRHVEQSYDLVAPALREGLTRTQWASGAIPVVPYPASDLAFSRWKLQYSYANRVGLLVAMFPKPKAKTPYEAFAIELTAVGPPAHRRWLVDSWAPAGMGIGRPGPPSPVSNLPPPSQLSRVWILGPIGFVVGLIVLLPASLVVRGYLRNRRLRRVRPLL